MASPAHQRGNPLTGDAGPVAGLLTEGGPFPSQRAHGVDPGLLDEFQYPLYGMWPAVLVARMAACLGDRAGHGDSLFPDQPRPRTHKPYPWNDFVGPLPGYTVRNQPRLRPGAPPGWRCPQNFARWARALAWMPGPAEGSGAELATDYEAFVGRALLGSPDHRLRGTRLPLEERLQDLTRLRA